MQFHLSIPGFVSRVVEVLCRNSLPLPVCKVFSLDSFRVSVLTSIDPFVMILLVYGARDSNLLSSHCRYLVSPVLLVEEAVFPVAWFLCLCKKIRDCNFVN